MRWVQCVTSRQHEASTRLCIAITESAQLSFKQALAGCQGHSKEVKLAHIVYVYIIDPATTEWSNDLMSAQHNYTHTIVAMIIVGSTSHKALQLARQHYPGSTNKLL